MTKTLMLATTIAGLTALAALPATDALAPTKAAVGGMVTVKLTDPGGGRPVADSAPPAPDVFDDAGMPDAEEWLHRLSRRSGRTPWPGDSRRHPAGRRGRNPSSASWSRKA